MKKYLLPLAMILLSILHMDLSAATVSQSDAQNVALNFFKVSNPTINTGQLSATLKYIKTDAFGVIDFYVFDISPIQGFVIVAGDDNIIPILGYSTESTFRTGFSHTGVSDWVYKTSTNISRALRASISADAHIQGQWSAYRQGQNPTVDRSGSVGPLCATRWDQEMDTTTTPPPYLYNLYCPFNSTDNQRCLTGCVATAMAQIMKFWNYPTVGTDSFSYDDNVTNGYSYNYGTQSSNFAAHTYQWQLMPTELLDSTAYSEDSAVDLLMYDCAVSVGMDFGDDNQNGSGANGLLAEEIIYGDSFCSQYALPKYFGYDIDTIRGVFEDSFSASSWTALIEHEINMGRPVLYEGNDPSQGGHAWVCDGYDANNYLHMNWGWGGFSDGFFAINNLTTPGNFDPIDSDDALIGILPRRTASGVASIPNSITFNMFPNPANNQLVLTTSDIENGAIWTITNVVGQTVLTRNAESMQTNINVSILSGGVYFVELQAGGQSMIKKLAINK